MVARAQGVGPKLAGSDRQRARGTKRARCRAGGGVVAFDRARVGGDSADAVSALEEPSGSRPGVAANAVAHAQAELGQDAELNALVRVALKRAAG